MKYYKITLTKLPDREHLIQAPVDMSEIYREMPAVSSWQEISRSTFYRTRRRWSQEFWHHFDQAVWGEQA